MAKKPKISVILTTYNNGDVLEACLKSIKNQSFKDFEIIVVDENSRDDTIKISKKYADKIIVEGHERCQKRNIGAKNASSDYLFFVDSDMELTQGLLKEINEKKDSNTLMMIKEHSFGKGIWAKCKAFERDMYSGGDIAQGVRVYPKKIFMKAKGFDERVLGAEDLDLFYRIKKSNKNIKTIELKKIILHNEGKPTYFQIVRRMSYYSKSFKEYQRRHPEMVKKQLSPRRYLKKWEYFLQHPFISIPFFIMKAGEAISVFHSLKK